MGKEKEFGFIIAQKISRNMTRAKLAEKFHAFLTDRKRELMKELKLPENRIRGSFYYDKGARDYKGMLLIRKACTENRIDLLNNENKVIWTAEDHEPYTISIYRNY